MMPPVAARRNRRLRQSEQRNKLGKVLDDGLGLEQRPVEIEEDGRNVVREPVSLPGSRSGGHILRREPVR